MVLIGRRKIGLGRKGVGGRDALKAACRWRNVSSFAHCRTPAGTKFQCNPEVTDPDTGKVTSGDGKCVEVRALAGTGWQAHHMSRAAPALSCTALSAAGAGHKPATASLEPKCSRPLPLPHSDVPTLQHWRPPPPPLQCNLLSTESARSEACDFLGDRDQYTSGNVDFQTGKFLGESLPKQWLPQACRLPGWAAQWQDRRCVCPHVLRQSASPTAPTA